MLCLLVTICPWPSCPPLLSCRMKKKAKTAEKMKDKDKAKTRAKIQTETKKDSNVEVLV